MSAAPRSLWVDGEERFYLVPDDAELAPGSVAITSLAGARRQVDAAALAPFAVTRAEADARIQEAARGFVDPLRDLLANLARSLGGPSPAAAPPPSPAPPAEELQPAFDEIERQAQRLAEGVKELPARIEQALASPRLEELLREVSQKIGGLADEVARRRGDGGGGGGEGGGSGPS